jgi:hypothetical protein
MRALYALYRKGGGGAVAKAGGVKLNEGCILVPSEAAEEVGTELEFVIMVIAVSCVKLLSAHNSTQHTSRKHKV